MRAVKAGSWDAVFIRTVTAQVGYTQLLLSFQETVRLAMVSISYAKASYMSSLNSVFWQH